MATTQSNIKAAKVNVGGYIDFGIVTYYAVKSIVTESQKRKPNVAKITVQAQIIADQLKASFKITIKEDTVAKLVDAAFAIFQEAK